MKKLPLLAAAGVGYVLGTKAGRERYDQITAQARKLRNNPRVQQKAREAADVVKEQAPVLKEQVSEAASAAAAKVRPGHDSQGDSQGDSHGDSQEKAPAFADTTSNPSGHTVTNPPQA